LPDFFLAKPTKTWEKYTKWKQNMSYGHNIDQMSVKILQSTIKNTSIFHFWALKNWTKLGFLGWKYTIEFGKNWGL
jgi:hypothetical protein